MAEQRDWSKQKFYKLYKCCVPSKKKRRRKRKEKKNKERVWGQTIYLYTIKKTYLYNFDPLKPHFYIEKLGFTGIDIIFVFLLKNIDYGYSLEPPRRGGSNEYP